MTGPDFERVVREQYAALYRFALSLARQEAEAADLTQQTVYLWTSRGHQLRDPARLKTWLFTTLYREFLRARRHADRFPHLELCSVDAELPVEEPPDAAALDGADVMRALQQVDEVFRAPLALFYLEDRSYREIAEILGVPPGTVMSRLARGKAQLRRLLADAARCSPCNIVQLATARDPTEAQHD